MKFKVITVLTLAMALFLVACGGKSDADLQKSATDKLAADKISGISVTVKDGVATLAGEVKDITDKTKADTSVRSVEGIKSVTNNVTVKAPTPVPAAPDPMLQGKVDEALKKAGCTGATAEISNGVITLSGSVPEAKYTPCFMAVSEVAGGARVQNGLQKGK
jgi:hyperosmotically inducible protein